MKLSFDITATQTAYREYLVSSKMNHLSRLVHDRILEEGYLDHNSKKITKSVEAILKGNDEVQVASFIGQFRYHLPPLKLSAVLNNFQYEEAKMIAAKLLLNIFQDNGSLVIEDSTEKMIDDEGKLRFKTLHKIIVGDVQAKEKRYRGIESSPTVVQRQVKGRKLTRVEKEFLELSGDVPLKVSDICTKELLMKGYSLKEDWNMVKDKNGNEVSEHPVAKQVRYRGYADEIMELQGQTLYMPTKYDHRDRVYYYNATLEGIRVQGKFWETMMVDSAEAYVIDEYGVQVLTHLLYCTWTDSQVPFEAACALDQTELQFIDKLDPMTARHEEEFGQMLLLKKLKQALDDADAGKPSHFMFGYDFTNSGVMMAGASFRSPEMAYAGNLTTVDEVVDSHTNIGEHFGLDITRKQVKNTIHQGLLHGSTLKTIADRLNDIMKDESITEDEVLAKCIETYGEEVMNIQAIADWGADITTNYRSSVMWTMPDGVKARHDAYIEKTPITIHAISAQSKKLYNSTQLTSKMPMLYTNSGKYVFTKQDGVTTHVRGLYADITHSIDAYVLRQITRAVREAGFTIMLKHDNFMVPPAAMKVVKEAAISAMEELSQVNLYQSAIDEIAKYNDVAPIELLVGEDDLFISGAANFLMP